jgi:hypothetical protein
MRYQLAQIIQAGRWFLGLLVMLPGCVTTTQPMESLPSLPCPVTSVSSTDAPHPVSQNQTIMTHALQKRLQEKERTIAAQTQQIEVLSSQLEALKQIDQETRRQPRKRLTYPIP